MESWDDSRPGPCNILTVVESDGLFFRSSSADPCSEKHRYQQHPSPYGISYHQKTASVYRI